MIQKHKGMFLELDYGKNIKLDLKDKKIISILGENCRTSATTIGKSINTSKHTVGYRVNQLIKKDIYRGNIAVLNPFVLGFPLYSILIKLKSINYEKENKIINFIENHPFIIWASNTQGAYDFNIIITAKNQSHFNKLEKEIKKKFSDNLKEIKTLNLTKINSFNIIPLEFQKEFHMKLIKNKKDSSFSQLLEPISAEDSEQRIKPSLKEILILKEIANNANLTLQQISEKTKIKSDTVKNTIKNLIKKNIILAFRAKMNVSFLKYHVYIVYFKLYSKANKEKVKEFEEFLKYSLKTACSTKASRSYYDSMNFVFAKNPVDFNIFINNIRNKFSSIISEYDTDLILTDYKINFFPKGMLGSIKSIIVKLGVRFKK